MTDAVLHRSVTESLEECHKRRIANAQLVVDLCTDDLRIAEDALNDLWMHELAHVHPKEDAWEVEEFLSDLAAEDCVGAYNCGEDFYVQRCLIDGVLMECRGDFEYNRYDKTYYYIDRSEFTWRPL